jgi:Calx-beta domain
VSFTPGQTSATVTIALTDDATYEADETAVMSLQSPSSGARIGTRAITTLTIRNNDLSTSTGVITLDPESMRVLEGGPFPATIHIRRSGGNRSAATVKYQTFTNSAAQAGTDYEPISGEVSWANGEHGDKDVTIEIINDHQVEGIESFGFRIFSATGATLGRPQEATIQIQDPLPTS